MALDYEADKGIIKNFLAGFYTDSVEHPGAKDFKYAKQLTAIANREQVALYVSLDDLEQFDNNDNDELIAQIERNARRYTQILCEAVADLLPDYKTIRGTAMKDALDIYIDHRLSSLRDIDGNITADLTKQFPPELLRRFEAYWVTRSPAKVTAIRNLRAEQIGKLVTIHGTVIRVSEVRPLLTVATYSCDMCSAETFQPIGGPIFSPLITCSSEFCKSNKSGGRLQLQTRGSKFVRFQELKVQEPTADVPAGHVPRTLTIQCKGESTRLATAGDHVAISGIFLPLMKGTAFAQLSQGLLTDTFLEAHKVQLISKWDEGDIGGELTPEELEGITDADFYEKLAASIAPEVYGHEDVKKSLLLMLVGGVERNVEGLKIRGTINICLMGDPGVAKSQLLSYMDRLAPRSQLTSGRGSSGVGLTASIMKDPITGLMTLEAGALMLADEGVCCIDEFDKMNEYDRTALHEVMEQQTISIAKAGILTTLHARTSVLAAANPAYGRYNPRRSIQENIALPAALLSRFDLLWLLQDLADLDQDARLAKHITYVHQHLAEPPRPIKPLDMKLMRRYIITCRKRNPSIPPTLSDRLVEAYVHLRNDARNEAQKNHLGTTFTSPRSLLAILRLSTALARLRLSDEVIDDDVNEAIRLVEKSRDSVKPDQKKERAKTAGDTHSQILDIIRKLKATLTAAQNELRLKDIRTRCAAQGFTTEQVDRSLDLYETENVWLINANRTKITFL